MPQANGASVMKMLLLSCAVMAGGLLAGCSTTRFGGSAVFYEVVDTGPVWWWNDAYGWRCLGYREIWVPRFHRPGWGQRDRHDRDRAGNSPHRRNPGGGTCYYYFGPHGRIYTSSDGSHFSPDARVADLVRHGMPPVRPALGRIGPKWIDYDSELIGSNLRLSNEGKVASHRFAPARVDPAPSSARPAPGPRPHLMPDTRNSSNTRPVRSGSASGPSVSGYRTPPPLYESRRINPRSASSAAPRPSTGRGWEGARTRFASNPPAAITAPASRAPGGAARPASSAPSGGHAGREPADDKRR